MQHISDLQSKFALGHTIGVRVCQPFYFGSTRTQEHLILGVLAKFSGVYYSHTPVNESPGANGNTYRE